MNTGKPDSIKSLGHSFQLKKKKCMLRVTCILTVLGFICVYMDCAKLHMYVHAQNKSILKHAYLRLAKTVIIHYATYLLICKHSIFVTGQFFKRKENK